MVSVVSPAGTPRPGVVGRAPFAKRGSRAERGEPCHEVGGDAALRLPDGAESGDHVIAVGHQ